MKLYLAPMEGVVDHHLRRLLTEVGGYSFCVTEFIRVTDRLLPTHRFYRLCPELHSQGKTPSGVPVIVQILGGDAEAMAENAAKLAELGAPGVDINFGCPAKKVVGKQGGSALLRYPQQINEIVASVRSAVPSHIPVTAKMRLGYESPEAAVEIAAAIEQGGADGVVVHARTKVDGYRHPARWEWLAMVRESITIPMVANGDINSVEDFVECQRISGCDQMMLGRGAMTNPGLAKEIIGQVEQHSIDSIAWVEVQQMLLQLIAAMEQEKVKSQRIAGRVKQWLLYLRARYTEAERLFSKVRGEKDLQQIKRLVSSSVS